MLHVCCNSISSTTLTKHGVFTETY